MLCGNRNIATALVHLRIEEIMSKDQIFYLMSGAAHLPYLVTSLWTLRRWWSGDIVIRAWKESWPIVQRIAEDNRLKITIAAERTPIRYRKNSQFIDKISVAQSMIDADRVLYLDADTTIHDRIDSLFGAVDHCSFAATQFNQWVSTGKIISKRIKRLREFPQLDQKLVEEVLANPWPSVNGGVWAARPSSPVLPEWHRWSVEARSIFIADETCLHALCPKFTRSKDMVIVQNEGRYNCSPMYKDPGLDDDNVVIWHYHGDSCCRMNKSESGCKRWWNIYVECLDKNIGGIREWRADVDNKYLAELERLAI